MQRSQGIAVVVWMWGHHQISSCPGLADDSFLHPGSTVPDQRRASGANGATTSRIGPLARFQCVRAATSAMRYGMR
jgi:hypothetical protein